MSHYDFIVVGGGIVGLATARALQRARPHARVAVLEKEADVARHQSSHNSGVIHAGVYYAPGSLKARLCRAGHAATLAFCARHDVPHAVCGKLIVASAEDERPGLEELAARAARNGLVVTALDAAELAAREPAVRGVAALLVCATGMADYPALCRRLAAQVREGDGEIHCNAEVLAIVEYAGGVGLATRAGDFGCARLVVCAGLQADRLARLAGLPREFAIVPFRGDYYRLPAARAGLVAHHIYPVPDARLPFLGVHLTRTVDDGLTVGPSAMLAFARERYRKRAFDLADCRDLANNPALWRLLARYPGAGLRELAHALSRRRYLAAVRRYCPGLELADLAEWQCGIRAQAVGPGGELLHDFLFAHTARSLHVCNAPSPAATSALPIAEHVVARLLDLPPEAGAALQ